VLDLISFRPEALTSGTYNSKVSLLRTTDGRNALSIFRRGVNTIIILRKPPFDIFHSATFTDLIILLAALRCAISTARYIHYCLHLPLTRNAHPSCIPSYSPYSEMRLLSTAVAVLFAGIVAAQNNAISVPAGQSTLDVTAGQPLSIEWTNPSSGTVTIKLQQDPITPDGGITLACTWNLPHLPFRQLTKWFR
jgi:hypothetical protein